jgi:hypothetical protein
MLVLFNTTDTQPPSIPKESHIELAIRRVRARCLAGDAVKYDGSPTTERGKDRRR